MVYSTRRTAPQLNSAKSHPNCTGVKSGHFPVPFADCSSNFSQLWSFSLTAASRAPLTEDFKAAGCDPQYTPLKILIEN